MAFRYYSATLVCLTTFGLFFSNSASAQQKSYDEVARAVYNSNYTAYRQSPESSENIEAKKLGKGPKHPPKYGVINYDIYRDRRPYPIDPRKPCHLCIQRKGTHPKFKESANRILGFQGRPYQEREPGGCLCGKKKQNIKHPNINVYWPSSLAGVREELFPVKSAVDAATYHRFHINDIYDHLGGFEVSRYERRDNGHCGPGRDRYGCLGESRQIPSNVAGVGFRPPGQPVERGGIVYP